jgi:3-oxoacyl-[acyl-carrier-protein] synthase II
VSERRVVITGMGVMSPVGNDCAAFFERLLAGRSGIRKLSFQSAASLTANVGGEVDYDPAGRFSKPKLAFLDRFSQLALEAASQAIADARIEFQESQKDRVGVFVGTGMGGSTTIEAGYDELFVAGKDRLPPHTVPRAMNNAAAGHVSIDHGLRGPSLTYSTACSSSAIAVGEAFRAIRHGYIDAAIAGGAESLLTLGTIRAWEALRALAITDAADPSTSCRPFSKDRSGLVLAEGAGMLMLEDLECAQRRGAWIRAEVIGYGASCDAAHLTRPGEEGQVRAMRLALADAHADPGEIDYINAHGTATLAGDVIETAAIRKTFGDRASRIPVSSTKSMHGHMMGAAGAVEFIAAVLAMEHGAIPPTANLRVPDPECDLDYVPNTARKGVALRTVMSNSFAFGGSNAVLVARSVA